MPHATALRMDFNATSLRRLAHRSKEAAQARPLRALAPNYDGGPRSQAARLRNVTLQNVRDWIVRFNAEGPDGLRDRKAPGPTLRLTDEHCQALVARIDQEPILGHPRRGALAAVRTCPVAVGGVPRLGLHADSEPGGAVL